jgi:hypothetical protein
MSFLESTALGYCRRLAPHDSTSAFPPAAAAAVAAGAAIPVRQQQLLGPRGTLSSHVLLTADGDAAAAAPGDAAGNLAYQGSSAAPGSSSMALLSHSFVVQTGLGSYVQVGP